MTLATYQILTYRADKTEEFPHFELFDQRDWGLIIYDEVHLLPAPVFRVTAQIQARRRLGLTATLIREDGREGDVFSLIGPKKYDVPWRELETQGWIAEATCTEVRVALPEPAADGVRRRRAGATSTASPARTRPRTTSSAELLDRYARPAGARHRPVPEASSGSWRKRFEHPAHHRRDRRTPSARTCTTSSAAARCGT